MNNVMKCKRCGKEIASGKYCKMCKEERKAALVKAGKTAGEILGVLGSLALAVVPFIPKKNK